MKFREKLRRGRSHLLLVTVMLATSAIVIALDDADLTRKTGKNVVRLNAELSPNQP